MIKEKKSGQLIVISAPSGCGKGSVINGLLKKNKNMWLSVSTTSRKIRQNDIFSLLSVPRFFNLFTIVFKDGGRIKINMASGTSFLILEAPSISISSITSIPSFSFSLILPFGVP